jgi:transcriptional regulator with GAF, ATPase, and Fis domain
MDRIRRLARSIAVETDQRKFYNVVVDLAVESTGAERGMLVAKQADKLCVISARNVDKESLRGREARLSLTIAREAMAQETPILVEDALRQEGFSQAESVAQLGLRSVLCVPVWLNGETVAAIYVDSRFISAAFGSKDAHMLETIADLLSLYMWKAGMEDKLAAAEARFAMALKEADELREQLQLLGRLSKPAAAADVCPEGRHPTGFPPMIGTSPAMQKVYGIISRVLDNDITVLITGESGTGKELVARAIFEYGRRKAMPFVAINCSSIPSNLIESELFGHLKGAFTGAVRDKKGRFEVADGGTLFMDEVGDMPLDMQGKLLRALQYGEIQRLGSVTPRKVDVRVVAATNKNLEEQVSKGAFREDLFYRLNIVSIEVPPLRKRKEDIPMLVEHFVEQNRKQGITTVAGITPQALLLLRKYPWPGNVRELETVLKSACLFAEKTLLDADDFQALVSAEAMLLDSSDPSSFDGRTLAEIEKDVILGTLKKNNGNKKKTALELGIDRRTLYNKLKVYGLM